MVIAENSYFVLDGGLYLLTERDIFVVVKAYILTESLCL